MIIASLILFVCYMTFQCFYIFIPLFSKKNGSVQKLEHTQSISIIVPAFNEEKVITSCIQGIIQVDYDNYEAIIVNDGSTDQTQTLLNHLLDLTAISPYQHAHLTIQPIQAMYQSQKYPQLFVIEKQNGGKADALNAGLNYASSDIVITLDADSVLKDDALHAINSQFQDTRVIAGGGMVQISQGIDNVLHKPRPKFSCAHIIKFQIMMYLTDFYLMKTTQEKFRSISVIAGAFGAFRKHACIEVGGYRHTVGEDLDITLKIHQLIKEKYHSARILFIPNAICYTECPSSLRNLFKQRIRWQKGFLDCIIHFRFAFFRKLGIRVSTFLLIDSFMLGTINSFPTLLIPIFVILESNYDVALSFLFITFILAIYRSFTALIISHRCAHQYSTRDYGKILCFIPFESIIYRLLGIFFVIFGTFAYIWNRHSWSSVERIGVHTYEPEKSF